MSYGIGKMGLSEAIAIIVMKGIPRVFLSGPSQIIAVSASAGWWIQIVGATFALIAFFTVLFVYKKYIEEFHNGQLITLTQFLQEITSNNIGAIISLVIAIVIFIDGCMYFRAFSENTLITALPYFDVRIVLLTYVLTGLFIASKGYEVIGRASYIIMMLLFIIIGFTLVSLISDYDVDNLFPLQGNGIISSLKNSVWNMGVHTGLLAILITAPAFQNIKVISNGALRGTIIAAIVFATVVAAGIMEFGINVASERTMLFFDMARSIDLNKYLQRVESFFILGWVTAGILISVITMYLALIVLGDIFKFKTLKPLFPIYALAIFSTAMLPTNYNMALNISDTTLVITTGIAVLLVFIVMVFGTIKLRRKSKNV